MITFLSGVAFGLISGFLSGIFVYKNNEAKVHKMADLAKAEAEKVAAQVSDKFKK